MRAAVLRVVAVAVFLTVLAALLFPGAVQAQDQDGDKYVLGGAYTLEEGETLNGNLVILGGVATLEAGSKVNGDVVMAGGTLRISGEVDGNIVATGGLVRLLDTALVDGDVSVIAANLERAAGARITGQVNTGPNAGRSAPVPVPGPGGQYMPGVNSVMNPLIRLFWYFVRSFLWAALAVLVVLFLPAQVERTAHTIISEPLISGGLGLLTVLVVPLMLVVIAITLIGIPVSLLGLLLLASAWAFGLVALGTELGRRLAGVLKQEWPLAMMAGIGTLVLTLLVNGISNAVPCVGWVAPAVAGVVSLGAVLLTRFGTRPYPPYGISTGPGYAPVVPAIPPWEDNIPG